MCKSLKAVVIGTFDGSISIADCLVELERLVDYLISMQI